MPEVQEMMKCGACRDAGDVDELSVLASALLSHFAPDPPTIAFATRTESVVDAAAIHTRPFRPTAISKETVSPRASSQGLTLVHYSAQLEPFLTQNTP
jgi:hypothetical protein